MARGASSPASNARLSERRGVGADPPSQALWKSPSPPPPHGSKALESGNFRPYRRDRMRKVAKLGARRVVCVCGLNAE
eukprot:scaffold594_cov116-Isochrysis_galbana.AAC.7